MDDFKEKQRLLDTAGQLHYELTAVLAAGTRSAQDQAEQEQSQQEREGGIGHHVLPGAMEPWLLIATGK